MIALEVFIPVLSNQGDAFSPEHDGVFEAFILSRFGGFSRLPGLAAGAWIGEGGFTYRDASRLYLIALASVVDGGKLGEVITFAKRHYAQEAIFIRYLGVSEIL